jgi:hypothetical protein
VSSLAYMRMPVLTLLSPSFDVDSIACGATCQTSDNICGARLDSALLHPLTCSNGGGQVFSHERVNDVFTEIAQDTYGKNCATNKRKLEGNSSQPAGDPDPIP